MATFEECGLKFLTASSVQQFSQNPANWVTRHLMGVKSPLGPSVARANAIRAGASAWLHGLELGKAQDIALGLYDTNILLMIDNEEEVSPDQAAKEQDSILPMLDEFCKQIEALGIRQKPTAVGTFNTVWLSGIDAPFMTRPDFVLPEAVLDLVTGHRLLSQPSFKDLANAALHMLHRGDGQPYHIISVTMKKSAVFTVSRETAEETLAKLQRAAAPIQAMVSRIERPEDALAELPLQEDHYLWTPDQLDRARSILPLQPKQEIPYGLQLTRSEQVRETAGWSAPRDLLPGRGPGHPGGNDQRRDQEAPQDPDQLGASE